MTGKRACEGRVREGQGSRESRENRGGVAGYEWGGDVNGKSVREREGVIFRHNVSQTVRLWRPRFNHHAVPMPCPCLCPSPAPVLSCRCRMGGSEEDGWVVTKDFVMDMLREFKEQRTIHVRFAYEILFQAAKVGTRGARWVRGRQVLVRPSYRVCVQGAGYLMDVMSSVEGALLAHLGSPRRSASSSPPIHEAII